MSEQLILNEIPRNTQGRFAKGAVGNPRGRPKGAKGRYSKAAILESVAGLDLLTQVGFWMNLRRTNPERYLEFEIKAYLGGIDLTQLIEASRHDIQKMLRPVRKKKRNYTLVWTCIVREEMRLTPLIFGRNVTSSLNPFNQLAFRSRKLWLLCIGGRWPPFTGAVTRETK